MTTLKLFSAGLIATAALATPAIAREHYVAKRHIAVETNAGSAHYLDGRVCIPAPHVGACAAAPWTGDNVPCEPKSFRVDER
jgi:hypothetical protein